MRAKRGSTSFEGKVGFGGPDVEIAKAVRDAIGPDATLRLDANMGHAARTGSPYRIVLSLTRLGGIRETVKFIHACELMGVGFGSTAATAESRPLPTSRSPPRCRTSSRRTSRFCVWYVDDVIAGGPFRPKNDVVPVRQGPGLGVELDPDGLGRCAEDFARNGELTQLDSGGEASGRLRRQ